MLATDYANKLRRQRGRRCSLLSSFLALRGGRESWRKSEKKGLDKRKPKYIRGKKWERDHAKEEGDLDKLEWKKLKE